MLKSLEIRKKYQGENIDDDKRSSVEHTPVEQSPQISEKQPI